MELEKRPEAGYPITSYGYGIGWTSPDLGQGAGAVAFLEVQLAGSKATNVLQLYDNDGALGMILYKPTPAGGYETFWSNPNMGEGSGAVGFLTADVNGDGVTEVVQLYDNDGELGMIVYSPTSAGAFAVSWQNGKMGQGSGALRFFAADVNGDGRSEIIQLWDNNGRLGVNLYVPNRFGGYVLGFSDGDVGAGSNAVAFLAFDIDGGGKEELVQLWDNNGNLGMFIYAMSNTGCNMIWRSWNLGAGSNAIAFLTGSFDSSGKTSIVQLWDNHGQLGMTLFTPAAAGGYRLEWNNPDLGQGSAAVTFLTGDVNGEGFTHIFQLWNSDGALGMIIYSPTINGGFGVSWINGNMQEGYGAVAFLTGSVSGGPQTDILQLWDNDGTLAAVLYSPVEA